MEDESHLISINFRIYRNAPVQNENYLAGWLE